MRKRIIAAALLCLTMAACSKDMPDTKGINEILKEENYVKITFGESYHQEQVLFDLKNNRAVIPKGAQWGLKKYRDAEETGVDYGEETDVYESDKENDPELYIDSYQNSAGKLHLTVKDVKNADYAVKIVKKEELEPFEEELAVLSDMVVNDAYNLAGVEIQFDKKFRPVKKIFQFEKKDSTMLEQEEEDIKDCTQMYSYGVGETEFNWSFKRVKKMIQEDN